MDDYLAGRMSEAKLRRFEARLAAEPELAAELSVQRRLYDALDLLRTKEKLKQAQIAYQKGEKNTSRPVSRSLWSAVAVAAAFVGVALSITYYATDVFKSTSEVAFNEFYQPESGARGGCPQDLPAFPLYARGDYKKALASAANASEDLTRCRAYFAGLNRLALGQPLLAAEDFTLARESTEVGIRRKAVWYLGLSYLKAGNEAKARQTFRAIGAQDDPEHPYASSAAEILRRLTDD